MLNFICLTEIKKINNRNRQFAKYKCDCGLIIERNLDNVKYGNTSSCGKCKPKKLKSLPLSINNIVVVEDLGMNNQIPKKRIARFMCDCGNIFTARVNAVKVGDKKSCGCIRGLSNLSHGLSNHPLYRKWSGMLTRTTNQKESHYHRYGGRGIIVCDEWKYNFLSFYDWGVNNGWEDGLTIDRINNDGDYEPLNCQWITMKENTMKDLLKFKPSDKQIEIICDMYINDKATVSYIADYFNVYSEAISKLLKGKDIKIDKNRRM